MKSILLPFGNASAFASPSSHIAPPQHSKNDIPFWFMRQAGRYLPEYRKVRAKFPAFLDMCLDHNASTEVALQPLTRFDVSAAILFSDIMMLPHALGIKVHFVENRGPVLEKLLHDYNETKILNGSLNTKTLSQITQNIQTLKKSLPSHKGLIGFSGSPWTLLCYMLEGESSKNFANTIKFIYENELLALKIIHKLADFIATYLITQIEAGADIVQLFDSWAGILPDEHFTKFIIQPTQYIASTIKTAHPNIPIIGFAKAIGEKNKLYADLCNLNGVSLDQNIADNATAQDIIQRNTVIQGGINNILLTCDKSKVADKITAIVQKYKNFAATHNFKVIFNASHGLLPNTNIDTIKHLIESIKYHTSSIQ